MAPHQRLPFPLEPFPLTRTEHRFEVTLLVILYLISVASGAYYIYELPEEDRWAGGVSVSILLLSLAAIYVIYQKFSREKKRAMREAGVEPYRQEAVEHGAKGVSFKT